MILMAVLCFLIYGMTSPLSEGSALGFILFRITYNSKQNSCSLDDGLWMT